MYLTRLQRNLPGVEERIGRALERSGRPGPVTLVAVTKGHPIEAVRAAVEVGLLDCGENRVAELEEKHGSVVVGPVRWHLIGHLQRNKVRKALPLFELVHSVDSLRLAREIANEAERADTSVRVLVQVNASGEDAKGGFDVADGVGPVADVVALPHIQVCGLMTMAPYTEDTTVLRRTFARTRSLFDACAEALPGFQARHLSMGMSNDFEIAIEEGSTMVRLGTILFGERQ